MPMLRLPQAQRHRLAEVFAQALSDRDPAATQQQLASAREKAHRAPLLMVAVACLGRREPDTPSLERMVSMGAAIQNLWLTATERGLGVQFVSTPMEIPTQWTRIERLLDVPDDLALMAVYRIGHVPARLDRPRIDWTSRHRKQPSDFVFRNSCRQPEADPVAAT